MQDGVRGSICVVGRVVLVGPLEPILGVKRRQLEEGVQWRAGTTGGSASSRGVSFFYTAERVYSLPNTAFLCPAPEVFAFNLVSKQSNSNPPCSMLKESRRALCLFTAIGFYCNVRTVPS